MQRETCLLGMKINKISIIVVVTLILVTSQGSESLGYGGPPEQSSAGKYTVEIASDKESYSLGESVTFSGIVNKYDEDRNLRISIFDSNKSLMVTQKVLVNTDSTFSHDVLLNEKFVDGKFIVKTQYGNSKATIAIMSFVVNSDEITISESNSLTPAEIPKWIKNNAGWWADGTLDDSSFVQGIQFLIKEGFVEIPLTEQGSDYQDDVIPKWIKNNAGWWADGTLDDSSFVQGIQFLIKEGFMTV